jgi:hypothetical protein
MRILSSALIDRDFAGTLGEAAGFLPELVRRAGAFFLAVRLAGAALRLASPAGPGFFREVRFFRVALSIVLSSSDIRLLLRPQRRDVRPPGAEAPSGSQPPRRFKSLKPATFAFLRRSKNRPSSGSTGIRRRRRPDFHQTVTGRSTCRRRAGLYWVS